MYCVGIFTPRQLVVMGSVDHGRKGDFIPMCTEYICVLPRIVAVFGPMQVQDDRGDCFGAYGCQGNSLSITQNAKSTSSV